MVPWASSASWVFPAAEGRDVPHIHIHIHIHIYIYICIHYALDHIFYRWCIYIYVCIYIHICHINIYIYTDTSTYTYIYIYIYICHINTYDLSVYVQYMSINHPFAIFRNIAGPSTTPQPPGPSMASGLSCESKMIRSTK